MSNNDVGHVLYRDAPCIHLCSLWSFIPFLFPLARPVLTYSFISPSNLRRDGRSKLSAAVDSVHVASAILSQSSGIICAAAASAAVAAGSARRVSILGGIDVRLPPPASTASLLCGRIFNLRRCKRRSVYQQLAVTITAFDLRSAAAGNKMNSSVTEKHTFSKNDIPA